MSGPLGVILAGGLSTRMGGGEKSLLEINGQTLMARVIARLAPQVDGVVINANRSPDHFAGFGFAVIADETKDFSGPLAGILAGMDWAAAAGRSHIVTVAADTPFFPIDLVQRFEKTAQATGADIVLAATPDPKRGMARHPTFGLWPTALREDLRTALRHGVRKVVAWSDTHPNAQVEFAVTAVDPFFNVNTPEDMDRAAKYLAEGLV